MMVNPFLVICSLYYIILSRIFSRQFCIISTSFAQNVRVLHFLDGLQISWRRWEGRKTLRRGGSPLLFVRCFSREIEKGPGGGLMDDGLRP